MIPSSVMTAFRVWLSGLFAGLAWVVLPQAPGNPWGWVAAASMLFWAAWAYFGHYGWPRNDPEAKHDE